MNHPEIVIKVVSAIWCKNCSVLKKSLDNSGIEYQVVDADDFNNQDYLKQLSIKTLPTTFFEVDGVVIGEPKRGLVSVAEIRKTIEDITAEMEGK